MLKEKLLDDLKNSMKEKNVIRKNVIQMVRAAILQVEKDKQIEVTDNQIVEIIAKETKKRKDSIVDYEKSGRQDLLDQINEEIAILEEYLPEQLSTEEVEAKVKENVENSFEKVIITRDNDKYYSLDYRTKKQTMKILTTL